MSLLDSLKRSFGIGKQNAKAKPTQEKTSNNEAGYQKDHQFLPDAAGLYPVEILMLFYIKKYKVWTKYESGATIPRFWEYQYGVKDVLSMIKSLEARGFISNGTLTESGEKEILRNPYVLYMHQHNYLEIGMSDMNALMLKHPNMDHRDVIWGELNRISMEHMRNSAYSLYRNTKFSMSRFLREEGKLTPALSLLCEVISYDLNMDSDPLIAPGVITELRQLSDNIGMPDHAMRELVSDALEKVSIPEKNYPKKKIVDFIIMAAYSDTPARELCVE